MSPWRLTTEATDPVSTTGMLKRLPELLIEMTKIVGINHLEGDYQNW